MYIRPHLATSKEIFPTQPLNPHRFDDARRQEVRMIEARIEYNQKAHPVLGNIINTFA